MPPSPGGNGTVRRRVPVPRVDDRRGRASRHPPDRRGTRPPGAGQVVGPSRPRPMVHAARQRGRIQSRTASGWNWVARSWAATCSVCARRAFSATVSCGPRCPRRRRLTTIATAETARTTMAANTGTATAMPHAVIGTSGPGTTGGGQFADVRPSSQSRDLGHRRPRPSHELRQASSASTRHGLGPLRAIALIPRAELCDRPAAGRPLAAVSEDRAGMILAGGPADRLPISPIRDGYAPRG